MAERRPLVLISGVIQQLPVGDTVIIGNTFNKDTYTDEAVSVASGYQLFCAGRLNLLGTTSITNSGRIAVL